MHTDMHGFEDLTLNEIDMPISYSNVGFTNISSTKSIEEVLLTIYTNENHNISFEELKQKIIDFYFNDASEEMIEEHLDTLTSNLHESVSQHIFQTIMYSEYANMKEYNLNAIKSFISIPCGNNYLYDFFTRI